MIRIQLLTGTQQGLTQAYNDTQLTFGRAAENQVVINESYLSRVHGEIRVENGQYVLINHSGNGTTLNGKKVKKPMPLQEGDIVGIGKNQIFAVGISGVPQVSAPVVDSATRTDGRNAVPEGANVPRFSTKAKLWMGIGGFWAVVIIVVMIANPGGKTKTRGSAPVPLTPMEIKNEIRTPIEKSLNQGEAAIHLQEAQQLYSRLDSSPDAMYRCYRAYKLSLAYQNEKRFEPAIQLKFIEIETKLIKRVTDDYLNAHILLQNQEWRRAIAAFTELTQRYPASQGKIAESIQKLIAFARGSIPKKKGFF